MQHSRWHRVRFWLKIGALLFALVFAGIVTYAILRIEKIILAYLPPEIQAEQLSVSFLHRSFLLSNVKIFGRAGSPCAGRLLVAITELTGNFVISERRLSRLAVNNGELFTREWQPACFRRDAATSPLQFSELALPSGLELELRQVRLRLPYAGEVAFSGTLQLTAPQRELLQADASKLLFAGTRLQGSTRRFAVELQQSKDNWHLRSANFAVELKIKDLEKIPQLSSRRLTVVAGNADIRLLAMLRNARWKIVTDIELSKVKLRGEPFYSAPLGLLQFTPENVWPMVEDSPGIFAFSFETEAEPKELAKSFAADLRRALTKKAKGNLKKKVPVLPF